MTRKYAKAYVSMWDAESDFIKLTADAQWLYWVLFSHPALSPAGVLQLQPKKWQRRGKGMTAKRLTAALEMLAADHYVLIDEVTEECLIRTYIRHDQGWRTPNIRTSIRAAIRSIESQRLRVAATHELTLALRDAGIDPEGSPKGSSQPKGQGLSHRTPPQDLSTEDSQPPPEDSSTYSRSLTVVAGNGAGIDDLLGRIGHRA